MANYLDENGLLYLWQKIKTALAGKSDTGHTHNYAGSSSAGGSANSAVKLDTSAGSATQPVYFSNGVPVKTTHTLGKSVPADAVFTDTDTTYSAGTGISLSGTTFSNSGVRAISVGTTNGTISVNTNGTTAEVAVKGLGSAAYTDSTAYDAAGAANTAVESAKAYTDDEVGGCITGLSVSGKTITYTKGDGTTGTITTQDTNTTYGNASASAAGLMTASDYSKLAAFGEASTYALKTDISGMYKYKGSVSAVSGLPSSGNTTGDVYNVTATGMNYAWNGTEWDALGETFTITAITNSQIDTIVAS